jgi:hypothetical protein
MKVAVLVTCKESDLDTNESIYIETIDTVYPRGYNLRCGSKAGTVEGMNHLSTFVHVPAVYESTEHEHAVKEAVLDEVQKLSESCTVNWAGPFQRSVSEINSLRNAKQFCSWAGPVKGFAIASDTENHETSQACGLSVIEQISRDLEERVKSDIEERKAKTEAAKNIAKAKEATELRRCLAMDRQCLVMDIKTAEDAGLVDVANSLKRKLCSILSSEL